VRVCGGEYGLEMIAKITLFIWRVWEVEYREELILNVTVFVVRVWEVEYREELILNVTVFCEGLGRGIEGGTDSEYYCVCWESLRRGQCKNVFQSSAVVYCYLHESLFSVVFGGNSGLKTQLEPAFTENN
jgi:hypothetical protein